MDITDRTIIKTLQNNARTSLKGISKQINLSLPATRERIKKLEQSGYIKGYTAILNHQKLDKSLTCFCMLVLKKQDPNCQDLFISFVKENADILECHCIAGEQEYIIKIITESMQTLELLLNCLRKDWGVIRSSTFAVLASVKEQPCLTY